MECTAKRYKTGTILFLLLGVYSSIYAQKEDFQEINFKKADSVAALYPKYPLDKLYELSLKLTEPFSTDVEKFRAIYYWVSTNFENDYSYYKINKLKREKLHDDPVRLKAWEDEFRVKAFKKLEKQYKTVCTGYAYLVKEMSGYAGIECEVIDGYGRSAQANIGGEGIANHSWNAVKLNDTWYLCDPTWSSGVINAQEGRFIQQFEEAYFLADPEMFVQSHYPLDTAWLLLKDTPTMQEFLNRPLVYKAAYRQEAIPENPFLFNVDIRKGEEATIAWKQLGDHRKPSVMVEVVRANRASTFFPEVQKDGQKYSITFPCNQQGNNVVHVLFNGAYALTYTFDVEK